MTTAPATLLQPRLSLAIGDDNKGAMVGGFDEALVAEHLRLLILQGYLPLSQEYTLMEHVASGRQGHYHRAVLIKNPRQTL